MTFLCDLHLHSRFSRATSHDLTVGNLDMWARIKGVDVLGTADFTHPGWREELHKSLIRDDTTGLYKYKGTPQYVPFIPLNAACYNRQPLFLVQTEISSIYKKNGKVRKVHNLIFVPSLEDADRFSARLEKIGNLNADGRPILGLDSHDLLEILLDTVPNAYLIPAHIWTPWFSLFGSRSGFDAIEECFEDLTGEIFALETGLSSDPAMNRLVSALDPYVLIANSDAHSGSKLAREVNIFAGNPSYTGIFQALKAASKREAYQHTLPCSFKGTSEFYPEEGKYHLDGHRSCQISLNPLTSKQHQNICPVCGKPLTIGVLHRVMDLADRRTQPNLPYEPPYTSHMPLLEITAELLNVGANSQKAINEYGSIIEKLGSELDVLTTLPLDVITEYWDLLGVAIERLRKGAVLLKGGYDGEFGEVHLFTKEELGFKPKGKKSKGELSAPKANLATLENFQAMPAQKKTETNLVYSLEQEKAIFHDLSPAVVLAGPGAGKTHLLMGRIKNLASQLPPTSILALTFTRRAAEEMRQRLSQILPNTVPLCTTLHAFCWQLIKKQEPSAQILSEDAAIRLLQDATGLCAETAKKTYRTINLLREQTCLDVDQELKQLFATYQVFIQKTINVPAYDFCAVLEEGRKILQNSDFQFKAVLVDEIQDCSLLNLTLVQALLPKNGTGFFGIGDPDQSIYAFRGACPTILPILERFWGKITLYHLGESFRSGKEILEVAQTFIQKPQCGPLSSAKNLTCQLHFCKAHSQTAEANWIAKQIASLLGSTAHSLLDTQKKLFAGSLAPSEIGILVRFKSLIPPLAKALEKWGIPVQVPEDEAFWQDPAITHFLHTIDPTFCQETFLNKSLSPEKLLPLLTDQSLNSYQMKQNRQFKKLCKFWEKCGNWEIFFEQLHLLMQEEDVRSKAEAVQILTLHAAKGLEYRAAFIPCLEEGILPCTAQFLGYDEGKNVNYAEEKRLFYVGITRATELLYLSCSETRNIYGKQLHLPVSPFFTSIAHFFQKSRIQVEKKTKQTQGSLFSL